MSEFIITGEQFEKAVIAIQGQLDRPINEVFVTGDKLPELVRCRDCKHLDMPDWDNNLAACYGEPPLFCMQLSYNEWRMDGDRRVADPTFLEVEPDGFCAWGERRDEER